MAIPTVQGSDVIAAPYAATSLDAGSLMGPGNAMQSVGRAIGYAGQVIGEFGERKQKAINAAAAQDGQMKMEKAFNDYQIEMSRMKDPDDYTNAEDTWADGWQKKASTLKNQILADPKISQAVKDHLDVSLSGFVGQSTDRINTQANTRSIQRQKAKLTNVASFMYENGDIERGDVAIEAMREHGLIFPEEEMHLKEKGAQQADLSQVSKGLNTDPIATLDALQDKTDGGRWRQFTNLDEETRLSLTRRARTEMESVRADTVRGFQDRINQGEFVKPDELQGAVDDRKLTPQQYKWLNAQQTGKANYSEDVVRMVNLTRQIDSWKSGDPDAQDQLHKIAADMAGLPKDMQNRLESDLNRVAKPGSSKASVPSQGYAYIDHLLTNGFFGPVKGEVEKEVPGKFFGTNKEKVPVTREEAEATYGKALALRDSLNAWVKDNPHATLVEQQKFINGQIQGQVDTVAATPVLNALTGRSAAPQSSTQTQKPLSRAEYDALPPGATYKGKDGRSYTKKK
jgi:hypothetical protein